MEGTRLTLNQLSDIKNLSKRQMLRQIEDGRITDYDYEKLSSGPGRKGLTFGLSCLTEAEKAEYLRFNTETTENNSSVLIPPSPPPPVPTSHDVGTPAPASAQVIIPGLADWQNKIACARYDLVCEYIKVREAAKKRKTCMSGNTKPENIGQVVDAFVAGYNSGLMLGEAYKTVGHVSLKTIERWHGLLKRNNYDFSVLAPRQGQHKKGVRKVSEHEMETMLRFALHQNRLKVSQVIRWTKRALAQEGMPAEASEATLRRGLTDWKDAHYDRWVFNRRGTKACSDMVIPYILRDDSVLEVGDCLVADGHTLNFNVINPFTGKATRPTLLMFYDWASRMPAGWYIMMTENTQCIHAALRRAILNLGKSPNYVYLDNGKAFKGKHFTEDNPDFEQSGIRGLYARLGIETVFASPYNARAKVVERFFGTFDELERLLPSYVGNSIEDKPAYLKRNEKLHQKLHNPYVPTINEADGYISTWIYEEYATREHRTLKAKPIDIWEAGKGPGVDEAGLRYLMMTIEKKTVHRNGVTLFGRDYYDETLYGYRKKVQVKYDILDMERIYIYTEDGSELICEAKPVQGVHPLIRMSDNPIDKETLGENIKMQKRLRKSTEREAREAAARIAPWNFPETQIEKIKELPMTQAQIEEIERKAAQMEVIVLDEKKADDMPTWEGDVYERLLQRRGMGEALDSVDVACMEEFEKSDAYGMLKSYYEDLEGKWSANDNLKAANGGE